ncbi:MAG: STAS domain-containing protein [Cyanobacteria bacterium P01_F01_bin.150]
MTEIKGDDFNISYESQTQTLSFQGSLRLGGVQSYQPLMELLNGVQAEHPELITLDLKELEFLNSSGISMISKFVINVRRQNVSKMLVKGSSNIPWQSKSLKNLKRLMPSLQLVIED